MHLGTKRGNVGKTIVLLLGSIIIVIAMISAFWVHFFIDPFVKNKIITSVEKASKGLYILKIDDLEAHFWTGAVTLKKVALTQDPEQLKKHLREKPNSSITKIAIHFDEMTISRIVWWNYLSKNDLEVGLVTIEAPSFELDGKKLEDSEIRASGKAFIDLLPGIIAGFAGSLRIEQLTVQNGKLNYTINSDKGRTHQQIGNLFVDLVKVKIDTASEQKTLYSDDIRIRLKDYEVTTLDKNYKLLIKQVKGSTADSILIVDSVYFDPLDPNRRNEKDKYFVFINSITTMGVDYPKLLREKAISLRSLIVESPNIHWENNVKVLKRSPEKKPVKENYDRSFIKILLPFIENKISIDSLSIRNGRINYNIINAKGTLKQKAENLNVTFTTASINKKQVEKINFSLRNYELGISSNNSKIFVEKIKGNTSSAVVKLFGVHLSQLHAHGKEQRFFWENSMQSVIINGIDFPRLLKTGEVAVNYSTINKMNLQIYLDDTKPTPENLVSKTPQDLVKNIPFYIHIKKFKFNDAQVLFKETNPAVINPYLITFNDINVEGTNFSNDKTLMTEATPAKGRGYCKVLGQGVLDFSIEIPLLSDKLDYSYSGAMEGMPGKAFNNLLEDVGVWINKGDVEPSTFDIVVKNGRANGMLTFAYKDLHVSVLDKKGKKKKFKSVLANFLIKNKNPEGHAESVTISTDKKENESFVFFLWRPVKDGVVETISKKIYHVRSN